MEMERRKYNFARTTGVNREFAHTPPSLEEVARRVAHLERIPASTSYRIDTIEADLIFLKTSGTDVAELESRLPALRVKVIRAQVESKIAHLQNIPHSGAYKIGDINAELQRAKSAGVEISDLEAQLPELRIKVARAQVAEKLRHLHRVPHSKAYEVRDIQSELTSLRLDGINVSDLEAQLTKLKGN